MPTNPKACPRMGELDNTSAFPFSQLRDEGVLWLINRVVFHPRGFALAYDGHQTEPIGWTIQGDGSETWAFKDFDEDELFNALESLLDAAREGRLS